MTLNFINSRKPSVSFFSPHTALYKKNICVLFYENIEQPFPNYPRHQEAFFVIIKIQKSINFHDLKKTKFLLLLLCFISAYE